MFRSVSLAVTLWVASVGHYLGPVVTLLLLHPKTPNAPWLDMPWLPWWGWALILIPLQICGSGATIAVLDHVGSSAATDDNKKHAPSSLDSVRSIEAISDDNFLVMRGFIAPLGCVDVAPCLGVAHQGGEALGPVPSSAELT